MIIRAAQGSLIPNENIDYAKNVESINIGPFLDDPFITKVRR